jgi:parallel beta helix pectate lyase-like protein
MRHLKWGLAPLAVVLAFVTASLIGGGTTPAGGQTVGQGPICGVIPTKLVLQHDAWLTCDVQCLQTDNQACIEFGRPNIKLSLNGFKMTGTTNEPSRSQCSPGSQFGPPFEADGVHSKFDEVQIVGPGVIQRMKRHGIGLVGTQADPVTKAQVKKVTSHLNCYSGVFLFWNSETLLDEVVSARNSANGEARPCGGICVTNSSRNIVRRSEVAGNGTTDPGAPTAPRGNDFGIGLVGESDFNLIEENSAGGNLNGLALFPLGALAPNGNLIKRNIFAGNPPTEVYDKNGPDSGSDVRDFVGAAGNNRFEQNLCLTYTFGGADVVAVTPPPCAGTQHESERQFEPKVPQFAGHQNN